MNRRSRVVLLAAAAAGTALAVPAGAAPLPEGTVNVVAGPQAAVTDYVTQQLVSTAGTVVTFANIDTTTHDVTSRATRTVVIKGRKKQVPLFASPITSNGELTKIVGTDKLKPGTYDFFCSLHPAMTGTLTVQG
jgi:plastocyanin